MKTRICIKCKKEFPTTYIDGDIKVELYNNRKCCLDCEPIGTKPGVYTNNGKIFKCNRCHKPFKYKTGARNSYKHQCCSKCYLYIKRTEVRDKAIEYAGGKCVCCNYDKFKDVLEFHHIKKKSFVIGRRLVSWARLVEEINKCILVCPTCHKEIHTGHRTPSRSC